MDTCPMKSGRGWISTSDRHSAKSDHIAHTSSYNNIYRKYQTINRVCKNDRYTFRPHVTKAICNFPKISSSYNKISYKCFNSSSRKNRIDAFSDEANLHVLANSEIKSGTCGKCKASFLNRIEHGLDSTKCAKYDTKCLFCDKFFFGNKGCNIHMNARHQK